MRHMRPHVTSGGVGWAGLDMGRRLASGACADLRPCCPDRREWTPLAAACRWTRTPHWTVIGGGEWLARGCWSAGHGTAAAAGGGPDDPVPHRAVAQRHLIRVFPDGVLVEAQQTGIGVPRGAVAPAAAGAGGVPARRRSGTAGGRCCAGVEDGPASAGAELCSMWQAFHAQGRPAALHRPAGGAQDDACTCISPTTRAGRFEVTRYPKLTEIGAGVRVTGRRPHGRRDRRPPARRFYTQDDLREVVAYREGSTWSCGRRSTSPGHSQSAIAAYPELGKPRLPAAGVAALASTRTSQHETPQWTSTGNVSTRCRRFPSGGHLRRRRRGPDVQWTPEQADRRGLSTVPELQRLVHPQSRNPCTHGPSGYGWDESPGRPAPAAR